MQSPRQLPHDASVLATTSAGTWRLTIAPRTARCSSNTAAESSQRTPPVETAHRPSGAPNTRRPGCPQTSGIMPGRRVRDRRVRGIRECPGIAWRPALSRGVQSATLPAHRRLIRSPRLAVVDRRRLGPCPADGAHNLGHGSWCAAAARRCSRGRGARTGQTGCLNTAGNALIRRHDGRTVGAIDSSVDCRPAVRTGEMYARCMHTSRFGRCRRVAPCPSAPANLLLSGMIRHETSRPDSSLVPLRIRRLGVDSLRPRQMKPAI